MIRRALKSMMPRSLFGRATLILLLPVCTILVVVSIVFVQRLYEGVTRQMTEGVAEEIRLTSDYLRAGEPATAARVARELGFGIVPDPAPFSDSYSAFDFSGAVVSETLHASVPGILAVALVDGDPGVRVLVDIGGRRYAFELPRSRVSARNPHQFLVVLVLTAILMTGIALIYLRNQVRPIRRLAAAAQAFGKGRVLHYHPSGATEVRAAGNAFLEMRDRIERQIEQRTRLLSGVSHDLRTPLTRMNLALGLMPEDEDTKNLRRDVAEMEGMLNAFLEFTRNEATEELETVDPAAILRASVDRAARGTAPVTLESIAGEGEATLRPAALARALDNLIGNAVRYGKKAYASLDQTGDRVIFRIEDEGPGIPEAQREEAMKPFVRLDTARNQDEGSGVGLGLAIAADVARRHGGTLRLGASARHGGLSAEIDVPR